MGCPMGHHRLPELETPPVFGHTSVIALSAVTALLAIAGVLSSRLLRKPPPPKIRIFLIWHLFDVLVHISLGASYLYNVFFTSMSTLDIAYTRGMHSTPMTPSGISFLGDKTHLYGSFYGTSSSARLWQEYAKADKRWGGSDLTIISVELLTVLVMTPLASYVCHLLRTYQQKKAWFWMAVIATGELYGGFMTLSPEWLAGSPNLDTTNFLTFWVYQVFFHGLWLCFPIWILKEACQALTHTATPKAVDAMNGSADHHPMHSSTEKN